MAKNKNKKKLPSSRRHRIFLCVCGFHLLCLFCPELTPHWRKVIDASVPVRTRADPPVCSFSFWRIFVSVLCVCVYLGDGVVSDALARIVRLVLPGLLPLLLAADGHLRAMRLSTSEETERFYKHRHQFIFPCSIVGNVFTHISASLCALAGARGSDADKNVIFFFIFCFETYLLATAAFYFYQVPSNDKEWCHN